MYRHALIAVTFCLGFTMAQAQALDDPTRPTSTVTPAAVVATPPERASGPPRFQPADYRVSQTYVFGSIRRAQINGEWLEPGAALRDGTLTAISDHSVTVTTPRREYVLTTAASRAIFRKLEEAP